MEKIYLQPVIEEIRKAVKNHEIEGRPGEYRRWRWQNEQGTRSMGKNEYGCADAMNLLYTINDFYCDEETRKARITALQSMQDSETGLFSESTHHPYHTTAHCSAALELFDVKPLYPIKEFHKYLNNKDELYDLLDNVTRWKDAPWRDSHLGAGVYAALVNSDEITPEFSDNYFAWFRDNADPVTGFWKKGIADKAPLVGNTMRVDDQAVLFQYMASGFHYLFNHEYAKQPLVYPEKVIDSCIDMYTKNGLPSTFGMLCDFLEIDWLYCLTRALRQTAHRRDEAMALIENFAVKYTGSFLNADYETNNRFSDRFNDLHCLFGAACCLAELQLVLPGKIVTDKPLKLVLDRRPFI